MNEFSRGAAGPLILSLDLDGTVWFGDPPGPISRDLVVALQAASVVLGSASDRTVADQRRLWDGVGITPEFIVVKNHLRLVRPRYATGTFVHIGDRFADFLEATSAGVSFIDVASLQLGSTGDLIVVLNAIRSIDG